MSGVFGPAVVTMVYIYIYQRAFLCSSTGFFILVAVGNELYSSFLVGTILVGTED